MDVLDGAAYPWATDPTTADDIAAMQEPPAWHADAARKEAPAKVSWFPGFGEHASAACLWTVDVSGDASQHHIHEGVNVHSLDFPSDLGVDVAFLGVQAR